MVRKSVWVIAIDKDTGDMVNFTTCSKNNSAFYKELYIMDGYNVEIMTDEEVDDLIARKNNQAN